MPAMSRNQRNFGSYVTPLVCGLLFVFGAILFCLAFPTFEKPCHLGYAVASDDGTMLYEVAEMHLCWNALTPNPFYEYRYVNTWEIVFLK